MFGFAARVAGGNIRAAKIVGLAVGKLILTICFLAGAAAGLAGMVEVAAVQGRTNANLAAGYGFTGILVAFLARQNPLAIIPGRDPARRHQRQRRPAAAPARPARRLGAGAAGHHLRRGAGQRRAVRPDRLSAKANPDMADGTIGLWTVPLAVFGGAIRVSTPFLFVSLGECITERSGRINLGLEGTLVMGAMSGYGISYLTGSPWLGVLAAGVAGALLGALHAGICSLPRVNDIAVGIALMLFGTGLAFYLGKPLIEPTAPRLPAIDFGWWSDIAAGARGAADQRAVPDRRRAGADSVLGVSNHALGPDDPHRRREFGRRARHGLFGDWRSACARPWSAASSPASAARSCRCSIPAAGTRASRAARASPRWRW